MTQHNRINSATHKRSLIVLACFALAAIGIIIRLAYLQISQYDYYQDKVLRQLTQETNVNPSRGIIYDTNGNILATNKTTYIVFISPEDIATAMEKESEENTLYAYASSSGGNYSSLKMNELIARALSDILGVDYDKLIKNSTTRGSRYYVVKKGVEEEAADEIRAFISKYKLTSQIYVRASATRYYPCTTLASHTIGFTNADGIGIYGLEKTYNNILEGTSGRYVTAQDAHNKDMPFEYESYVEVENGANITTTIDKFIQNELEKQLEATLRDNLAAERVTGIVLDVNTGGVLGMATLPSFDLNSPYTLDSLSQEALSGYTEGTEQYTEQYYRLLYRMWSNKAVTGLYEPGSTFKVITTAMALEEKVVSFNDLFTCTGGLMVEGWPKPINCHKATPGHGTVTFAVGLQQSCNPVLMMVGSRIGRENFYKYLLAFGYGEKTGIDLPSETRSIISSYSDFTNLSLATYSFGQTFKISAIQQITGIAAVANGGKLVTPHLVESISDSAGNIIYTYDTTPKRQVVSESICRELAAVLEEGVSGDGGARNAYVKGYKVAAKTGTSEKKDKVDANGEYSFRVGSTVAFAPADDPKIAVLIIVDEPMGDTVYGGTVAAPYVSKFLANVLPYLGIEPQYTDSELANIEVSVLNYSGASVETAKADLEWRGLECEIVGNGDTVTMQIPESGSMISKESGKVILYTGEETPKNTVTVPDLTGKSAEIANRILVNLGLNISITGASNGSNATVISQSVPQGTVVPRGTVVVIELRHMDAVG